MNFRKPVFLTCLALGLLASHPLAFAGTIRHDVDDSDYLDLAGASSSYNAVGRIAGYSGSNQFAASATLIAPGWALTAAHVLDAADAITFEIGGQSYLAADWQWHPLWDPTNVLAGYDIGLVRFNEDVALETGVTPAQRYTNASILGELGTSVGFGATGNGLTGFTNYDGNKRGGLNKLDTYLAGQGTDGNELLTILSDFDNPLATSDSSMGSDLPLGLEYSIAPGDSGGGLFVNSGGVEYLAGVHSFGAAFDESVDSDYGDITGHTFVNPFNDWIDEALGLGEPDPGTTENPFWKGPTEFPGQGHGPPGGWPPPNWTGGHSGGWAFGQNGRELSRDGQNVADAIFINSFDASLLAFAQNNPEPSTFVLAILGLLSLGMTRRRPRR